MDRISVRIFTGHCGHQQLRTQKLSIKDHLDLRMAVWRDRTESFLGMLEAWVNEQSPLEGAGWLLGRTTYIWFVLVAADHVVEALRVFLKADGPTGLRLGGY